MKRDRFQCLEALFDEAVGLEGAQLRELLERVGAEDAELRGDLERLLEQDREGDGGLDETTFHRVQEELAGATLERPARFPMERIGHYRILEKIGEGGMGMVFLAEQDSPHRRVALKVVRLAPLSPGLRRRFHLETEVLGRLQHPGIAQILEAGEIDTDWGRVPYFAMEYVDGLDLRRYVERHALGVRARLELVARICDAAHHAHQKGIVHRDLKPENVLVVDDSRASGLDRGSEFADLGQPKVLDFGIARVTDSDVRMTTVETGEAKLVGTLSYMSPEQLAGDSTLLDTRSDVYALGVLLYEVLSGQAPFVLNHRPIPEAARLIRDEEPTRLGQIRTAFRGDIETIVGRAMEKDRERRYSSAAELALDLRRYLASEPIIARSPSTFYRLGKFALRHTGLVSGIAMSFLFLLAGLVLTLRFAYLATQEKGRAQRSEAVALRAAYRTSLAVVETIGEKNPWGAIGHLDAIAPELRGWEWRHFRACFAPHVREYRGEADQFTSQEYRTFYRYLDVTACDSDGRLIGAPPRRRGVELIDLASGASLGVFAEGDELVLPILSPDGSHLAGLSQTDERLLVWAIRSRQQVFEMHVDPLEIRDVCFSPDAREIAVASRKGVAVYSLATGESLFESAPHPADAAVVEYSPDGNRMALIGWAWGERVADADEFFLSVHDSRGECLGHRLLTAGHQGLAFSPDGSQLVIGQVQRMIRVVDSATLEDLRSLKGHTDMVTALAYTRDASCMASASLDRTVRLWDTVNGDVLGVLPGFAVPYGFTSLSFSPDGGQLAAGSYLGIRLWSLKRITNRVLEGHGTYVYRVVFSPDGSLAASAGWDDTVRLWDPLSGEQLAVLPSNEIDLPFMLSFTPDGTRLIGMPVWDSATGCELLEPVTEGGEAQFETGPNETGRERWPRDWVRLAAGGSKAAGAEGERIAVSWDRTLVAEGLDSGEIRIEDRLSGETIERIGGHASRALAVAFDPDGSAVLSGHEDGFVKVWDLDTGAELATLKGHTSQVYSVNCSRDGERIVSGSNDNSIILWDTGSYEQVAVLRGHSSYVHSVCFSPDGSMLASASGDGTIRLWDTVPAAERHTQVQRDSALRDEVRPLVDRLLKELSDPLAVAKHLREAEMESESRRRAALRILLERSANPGSG